MSSSSSKPHNPLHNFPLQDLKWSGNQASSHRFRKPADCPNKLPHLVSDGSPVPNAKPASSSTLSPIRKTEKPGRKLAISESPSPPVGDSEKKPKPKICIRIKNKQIKLADEPAKQTKLDEEPAEQIEPTLERADVVNEHQPVELEDYVDVEESIAKAWNLRPRRRLIKGPRPNGGAKNLVEAVLGETKPQEPNLSESSCPNAISDAIVTEITDKEIHKEKEKQKQKKPKKAKFSIPLTKLEIEEDMITLTGSKPSRKPMKRARHVQKLLDQLFPGMWLSSITPDMYKVHEFPAKI